MPPRLAIASTVLLLATACRPAVIIGGGASLDNNGGSSNQAPAVSGLGVDGFEIEAPKVPPARINLTIADAESDTRSAELPQEREG